MCNIRFYILSPENSTFLTDLITPISHHEKWNGKGYPQGLAGENIPLCGRIVGLVDVFDALTSKRPYKAPYPPEVAIDIIRKERGQHFDPNLADVFLENIDAILKIKAEIFADDLPDPQFIFSERDSVQTGSAT
jgi:putative two-component system response regulator